jgi:serine/threonine-protein kinase
VISTEPAAQTKVKPHETVTIVVSTGPPVIDVPDVSQGAPYSRAESDLEQAGFAVERTEAYNGDVHSGAVISISPEGTAVKGTTVTVTVSKGPQMVGVPAIHRFESVDDAESVLDSAGLHHRLEPALKYAHLPGAAGSYVWTISPEPGKRVPVGSTVVIKAI